MKNRSKLIVLPLQPETGQDYNGIGLGIHFLLGNLVAVHSGLAECWFGWRVNKIFNTVDELRAFCRGSRPGLDIKLMAKQQKLRFILSGTFRQENSTIQVSLVLYDADLDKNVTTQLHLDITDFCVGFGRDFFKWLAICNLPLEPETTAKALWKENISLRGLEFLGYAVEATYLNYIDPSLFENGLFDLEWFEKAVCESPMSYLTNNLKGWALYKNKEYGDAKASFKAALEKNADGFGAFAGMMWCSVSEKDKPNAIAYAIAKANVKNDSRASATALIEKKFSN